LFRIKVAYRRVKRELEEDKKERNGRRQERGKGGEVVICDPRSYYNTKCEYACTPGLYAIMQISIDTHKHTHTQA